jgi:hypothetical protein
MVDDGLITKKRLGRIPIELPSTSDIRYFDLGDFADAFGQVMNAAKGQITGDGYEK